MGKAFFNWSAAPGFGFLGGGLRTGALFLNLFGQVEQAFSRIGAAIEQDIFDLLAQLRLDLIIDFEHACVDDAHIQTGFDGIFQERGVHRFAYFVVAAERERNVGDTARNLTTGQVLLNPARRLDEILGVIDVFFQPRGNRKHVGVEDDVLGWEGAFFGKDFISTSTNFLAAFEIISLAFFVEGHHDRTRTVAPHQSRLLAKLVLTFFERYRVDNGFALGAFEARFQNAPFGRIEHDRHAGDIGLGGDEIEEGRH